MIVHNLVDHEKHDWMKKKNILFDFNTGTTIVKTYDQHPS